MDSLAMLNQKITVGQSSSEREGEFCVLQKVSAKGNSPFLIIIELRICSEVDKVNKMKYLTMHNSFLEFRIIAWNNGHKLRWLSIILDNFMEEIHHWLIAMMAKQNPSFARQYSFEYQLLVVMGDRKVGEDWSLLETEYWATPAQQSAPYILLSVVEWLFHLAWEFSLVIATI